MLGPLTALAAGVLVSLLSGGSLDRLGSISFRRLGLFWLSLVPALVIALFPHAAGPYGVALVLIANALLVAFALMNRRLPGLWLVAAGVFLNALVISVNGAMPVSTGAARDVGWSDQVASIKHEPITDGTVWPFLADRVPIGPTNQVWSIGDFLMVAGFGIMGFGLPRRDEDGFEVADDRRVRGATV